MASSEKKDQSFLDQVADGLGGLLNQVAVGVQVSVVSLSNRIEFDDTTIKAGDSVNIAASSVLSGIAKQTAVGVSVSDLDQRISGSLTVLGRMPSATPKSLTVSAVASLTSKAQALANESMVPKVGLGVAVNHATSTNAISLRLAEDSAKMSDDITISAQTGYDLSADVKQGTKPDAVGLITVSVGASSIANTNEFSGGKAEGDLKVSSRVGTDSQASSSVSAAATLGQSLLDDRLGIALSLASSDGRTDAASLFKQKISSKIIERVRGKNTSNEAQPPKSALGGAVAFSDFRAVNRSLLGSVGSVSEAENVQVSALTQGTPGVGASAVTVANTDDSKPISGFSAAVAVAAGHHDLGQTQASINSGTTVHASDTVQVSSENKAATPGCLVRLPAIRRRLTHRTRRHQKTRSARLSPVSKTP